MATTHFTVLCPNFLSIVHKVCVGAEPKQVVKVLVGVYDAINYYCLQGFSTDYIHTFYFCENLSGQTEIMNWDSCFM